MPFNSFELIKFHSISKSYGPKNVLVDISFAISQGERFALIGENGCGKTTLARLIVGKECPDMGEIWISPQSKIGYLSQDSLNELPVHLSIQDFLLESQGSLLTLSYRMHELENEMAQQLDKAELDCKIAEWDILYSEFTACGGYQAQEQIYVCLNALNLEHLPFNRSLAELSEGERRRIHLASLLLSHPNILILDEPTNHLDDKAIEWLENYLCHFQGALFLISHDRHFLNHIATGIVELSSLSHHLSYYSGNYDDYLLTKKNELKERLEIFQKQKEEINSLKKFLKEQTFSPRKVSPAKDANKMAYDRRGERHMNGKRKSIAQAKQKLEMLESERLLHPIPKDYKGIYFNLQKPLVGPFALQLEAVEIEIGGNRLMHPFSATAQSGERIMLLGPNGSGKSTLLRLLASKHSPQVGKIVFASTAMIGFLSQEALFENEKLTLIDYLQKRFSLPEHELRSKLHQIALIEDHFVGQQIETLSLGQKRRLQLLILMLEEANLLLLDEPTNHLAPHIIDQLEEALLTFPGTIIAATHDRRFAQRIGTHIWNWMKSDQKV